MCPEGSAARYIAYGEQVLAELSDLLFAPDVDFFGCKRCRNLWHVDKGKEGLAGYALLGPRRVADADMVMAGPMVAGVDPWPDSDGCRR